MRPTLDNFFSIHWETAPAFLWLAAKDKALLQFLKDHIAKQDFFSSFAKQVLTEGNLTEAALQDALADDLFSKQKLLFLQCETEKSFLQVIEFLSDFSSMPLSNQNSVMARGVAPWPSPATRFGDHRIIILSPCFSEKMLNKPLVKAFQEANWSLFLPYLSGQHLNTLVAPLCAEHQLKLAPSIAKQLAGEAYDVTTLRERILQLSLLVLDKPAGAEDLKAITATDITHNFYQLMDAALRKEPAKVLKILNELNISEPAPSLHIWAQHLIVTEALASPIVRKIRHGYSKSFLLKVLSGIALSETCFKSGHVSEVNRRLTWGWLTLCGVKVVLPWRHTCA